jgi:hypothetical protein
MASIDFHLKISAHEAKEWIRNCMDAYDEGGSPEPGEQQFIQFITENKPMDFKAPRKSRASKKSSEERADSEYDCQLCNARVWNNALGGQCSRKKLDGGVCCSIHMKESVKNGGCFSVTSLRNGFVTEDRPTHAYGDETQQMLPWHDVEIPKKTKKTTGGGTGTRKCSNCGECGHNKKTCPLLKGDTEETVEKKEVEKKEVEVEEETVVVEETVVEEGEKVEKTESSRDTIVFEGVEYTFDEGEEQCRCLHGRVQVYDDELAEVGTWDGEKIEFLNATAAKFHRVRKSAPTGDLIASPVVAAIRQQTRTERLLRRKERRLASQRPRVSSTHAAAPPPPRPESDDLDDFMASLDDMDHNGLRL